MYATIGGYRINWPTGEDKILLVSIGTGAADPAVRRSEVAAAQAFRALLSLMEDCASLQETLLQWMSQSPTARKIDSELGSLDAALVGGAPLLSYVRYNVDLQSAEIHALLGVEANTVPVENLTVMDAPENMPVLHQLGIAAGRSKVKSDHFPAAFDLT
jgi:hypothetical protein